MAFAHALHEALALLHGGDFWFNTEEIAAALRKLGARSVDAADISAMLRGPAFESAGDPSNATGIFTRTNGNVRLMQIKKPGEAGSMHFWPQIGDRIFRRRTQLPPLLRDRVEAYVAPAALKRAQKRAATSTATASSGASSSGASGASSSSAGPALRTRAPATLPPWAGASLAPGTFSFAQSSPSTCRLRRFGADGETALLDVVLTAHEDGAHVTLSVRVLGRAFEVVAADAKYDEAAVHTVLAALSGAIICPSVGELEMCPKSRPGFAVVAAQAVRDGVELTLQQPAGSLVIATPNICRMLLIFFSKTPGKRTERSVLFFLRKRGKTEQKTERHGTCACSLKLLAEGRKEPTTSPRKENTHSLAL